MRIIIIICQYLKGVEERLGFVSCQITPVLWVKFEILACCQGGGGVCADVHLGVCDGLWQGPVISLHAETVTGRHACQVSCLSFLLPGPVLCEWMVCCTNGVLPLDDWDIWFLVLLQEFFDSNMSNMLMHVPTSVVCVSVCFMLNV